MKKNLQILDKPQFSGHETFPLRQLWLRKAYSEVKTGPVKLGKVFSDDSAIVRFGVGKNMVSAIRYWALAAEIITETDDGYMPTEFAELMFGDNGLDPYQEHPSTAWLIHWKLASEGRGATTWKWLFNYVIEQNLDTEHLLQSLKKFITSNSLNLPSEATLKKDIECCLRAYLPRVSGALPEEISDSVLGELSLLQQTGRGQFEFRRGPKQSLNNQIFTYCLIRFWDKYSPSSMTLSFDSIAHDYFSPGRVFKLDEASVSDRLQSLADVSGGELEWSDTAGMKQVIRKNRNINIEKILRYGYN
jgi:hypothetical protein